MCFPGLFAKPLRTVKKVWGREVWLVNEPYFLTVPKPETGASGARGGYCAKILCLMPGYACSLHMHLRKDETFKVLQGVVELEADGEIVKLAEGDVVHIVPGTPHRFKALGADATMLEVSTHHDDADVVRIEESRKES